MLIQLQDKVTQKWFEFGLTLGVPSEVMEKYKDHPPEECIIEMLDYWLRHHPHQPTWREIAHALKDGSVGLNALSNEFSQVYVTGIIILILHLSVSDVRDVIILILHLSVSDVRDVCDVRAGGHGKPFDPS